MRRSLAALAVLALFSLQSQGLAFHVHAVADHDDEHRHGPAIHDHQQEWGFDRGPHLEEPDADSDIITLAVPAAVPFAADGLHTELAEALLLPELVCVDETRPVETRSHSPPPRPVSFLRGPPSSTLL